MEASMLPEEEEKKIIEDAKKTMPDDDKMEKLSTLYHVFSDSVRLKIICALFDTPLNVNDLASQLDATQSNISHHLAILKANDLVSSKKNGKQVIYSLKDEHVKKIFEMGLEHILEKKNG